MKVFEKKLQTIIVDKKNQLSMRYLNAQIGKSEDNFLTLAIELPNKSLVVLRVGEILTLIKGAGLPC